MFSDQRATDDLVRSVFRGYGFTSGIGILVRRSHRALPANGGPTHCQSLHVEPPVRCDGPERRSRPQCVQGLGNTAGSRLRANGHDRRLWSGQGRTDDRTLPANPGPADRQSMHERLARQRHSHKPGRCSRDMPRKGHATSAFLRATEIELSPRAFAGMPMASPTHPARSRPAPDTARAPERRGRRRRDPWQRGPQPDRPRSICPRRPA